MSETISRRNFLKGSSLVGVAAAMAPATKTFSAIKSSEKSRVVVVKDEECSSGGTPDSEKIEKMVNEAVKVLTEKTDDGEAYEALFTNGIDENTKILMKRNDLSGSQRDFAKVDTILTEAFKKGCGTMLGGDFNEDNVEIHCKGGSVKSKIESCDYLINSPVCSCHGRDYGVTLSLKNTMTYLNNASTYHSANKKWLHEVSLDPLIKEKQVMSIMNAIVGNHKSGPMQAPLFEGHTVIMSRDLVSVDYNTMRLMEEQSGANTSQIATGDNQLKAAESAGLGICTPANMEVIEIGPPYTSGLIKEYNPLFKKLKVEIIQKNRTIEFILPSGMVQGADMAIFDMKGSLVWKGQPSGHAFIWHMQSTYGTRVPKGMYTFRVAHGSRRLSGVVMAHH